MQEGEPFDDLSVGDFAVPRSDAKSAVPKLIRQLVLATRRHKLDYGTLRYIHRQVIKRTKLSIPRPQKTLHEIPSPEELSRFFASIDDPQIKLLFQVLNNTGLRVSECCNLLVSRIDVQSSTVLISGKGGKDRVLPLSPKIIERINLFLSGRNHKFLFESSTGGPYSARRIEQLCKIFKEKAGIKKKLTPHTFRHYFFTRLAEQNVDVSIRALIAGHSSEKTQEVYTHLGMGGSKDLIIEVLQKMESQQILK